MKKLLLFVALFTAFASCKEESKCANADFVGTWKGTEKCSLLDATDVEVVITEKGTKLNINGALFVDNTLELDDCEVSGGTSVLGAGLTIKGTLTDGKLAIDHSTGASVLKVTCSYNLTKK